MAVPARPNIAVSGKAAPAKRLETRNSSVPYRVNAARAAWWWPVAMAVSAGTVSAESGGRSARARRSARHPSDRRPITNPRSIASTSSSSTYGPIPAAASAADSEAPPSSSTAQRWAATRELIRWNRRASAVESSTTAALERSSGMLRPITRAIRYTGSNSAPSPARPAKRLVGSACCRCSTTPGTGAAARSTTMMGIRSGDAASTDRTPSAANAVAAAACPAISHAWVRRTPRRPSSRAPATSPKKTIGKTNTCTARTARPAAVCRTAASGWWNRAPSAAPAASASAARRTGVTPYLGRQERGGAEAREEHA